MYDLCFSLTLGTSGVCSRHLSTLQNCFISSTDPVNQKFIKAKVCITLNHEILDDSVKGSALVAERDAIFFAFARTKLKK